MEHRKLRYYVAMAGLALVVSCQQAEVPSPEVELHPTLEMKSVTDSSVFVRVYANEGAEECYYYCGVMPVSEYDAMGGDEGLLSWGEQFIPELRDELRQGDQNIEITGLDPEQDYYVYVFPLSREGESGSAVVKEPFKTDVRTYPEFKGTITVDLARAFMLTLSVSTEDITDWFCVTSMPKSEFDAGTQDLAFMQSHFDALVASNLNLDAGLDRKAVLEALLITGGGGRGNVMYLVPETEYTVALLRLTPDGTVTGFLTATGKTTALTQTEGGVEFSYDKYYDASYLGFPGMAALPTDIQVSGDVTSWISASYRGDYTSTEEYPDYLLYSMILNNESAITDTPYIVYILPWDMDITLVGFGMDGEQDFCKVGRSKLRLTKDGASDIRDYLVPDGTPQAVCGQPGVRPTFVPVR